VGSITNREEKRRLPPNIGGREILFEKSHQIIATPKEDGGGRKPKFRKINGKGTDAKKDSKIRDKSRDS